VKINTVLLFTLCIAICCNLCVVENCATCFFVFLTSLSYFAGLSWSLVGLQTIMASFQMTRLDLNRFSLQSNW